MIDCMHINYSYAIFGDESLTQYYSSKNDDNIPIKLILNKQYTFKLIEI